MNEQTEWLKSLLGPDPSDGDDEAEAEREILEAIKEQALKDAAKAFEIAKKGKPPPPNKPRTS